MTLSLVINGKVAGNSKRRITGQGQFLLKGIVFAPPARVAAGDTIGYMLEYMEQNEATAF